MELCFFFFPWHYWGLLFNFYWSGNFFTNVLITLMDSRPWHTEEFLQLIQSWNNASQSSFSDHLKSSKKKNTWTFLSGFCETPLTSQKLRKCAFIYLLIYYYFKHKINVCAAELGRAVLFNVSQEMKAGKTSCRFSAAMRLLSGKALNTRLYLIKNFNTFNWNADITQGRSHLFSHNQKHLVP